MEGSITNYVHYVQFFCSNRVQLVQLVQLQFQLQFHRMSFLSFILFFLSHYSLLRSSQLGARTRAPARPTRSNSQAAAT